jgi:hypothetical protein
MKSLVRSLSLVCLLIACVAHAEVYRYTDADGNVVFSDQPPPTDSGNAETIQLRRPNSMPAPRIQPRPLTVEPDTIASGSADYSALSITSPPHNGTLRDNSGNLVVQVSLEPALADGHELAFFLDGVQIARGRGYSASAANVDRGSHTLEAVVFDANGNELIRSPVSQVHLKRFFTPPAQ